MLKLLVRLVVAVLVLAGVAAVLGYVFVRGHGFSARRVPGRLETTVAREARRLAIPVEASRRANPDPQNAESLKAGLEHFADHCAVCHGNDGSGDTEMGRGLYPKPPDMRLPATQALTDGELFYIIENGVPLTGMPAWGGSHEGEKGSWKLVQFIRHLPALTPQEIGAMKKLNPKGPDEAGEMDPDEFLKGADVPPARPKHTHGREDR